MSLPVETVGGWGWYVRMYKEAHPDTTISYKDLLQLYIKGVEYNV